MRGLVAFAMCGFVGCTLPAEDVDGRTEALRNLDAVETEFLGLLNEHRAGDGLMPVFDERACNTAARDYSQLMGEMNWFDHTGPDGSSPWDRMCDAGYNPACGPSTAVGENIAAGNGSAAATFEQWRTSPGHNRNMLDSRYRVVGIGRAEVPGSRYRFYWTNVFGGQITDETNMGGPMPDPDAGPPPDPDAGPPPTDAGPGPQPDAGPGNDAGPPPPDPDAGPGFDGGPGFDAGLPRMDAGPGNDSGTPMPPTASSDTYLVGDCAAGGSGSGAAWVVLALLWVRRRR